MSRDLGLPVEVLRALSDGVLLVDSSGTIAFASKSIEAALGLPLAGKRLSDIRELAFTVNPEGSTVTLAQGEYTAARFELFVFRRAHGSRWHGPGAGGGDGLPSSFQVMVGRDPRFQLSLFVAAQVAPTDATVLVRGESGVGKELLAKAIHHASGRKEGPLVKVNCAAIPESLLESELFGYEKGAFTGARSSGRIGKFELAHRGTLFLDEVGDMSPAMQAKVLRAIQEREIERVGGQWPIEVDVRIIAATNQDLESMVRQKLFREDLYYRLNVVSIELPPLRERRQDIPLLVTRFLERFCQDYQKNLRLAPEVLQFLLEYRWPGNVRELRNVLEHVAIVCSGGTVEARHLPKYLREDMEQGPGDFSECPGLKQRLAEVEKAAIVSALEAFGNNRTKAMESLGVSRRTFYRRLKEYGIS